MVDLEEATKELAEDLAKYIRNLSKEELLTQLLIPKYAEMMKDFTKEQILWCILKEEK